MLMKAPLAALALSIAVDLDCYMWTGWQRAETRGIGPGTWEYLPLRATTDNGADFGAPSTCERRKGGGTFTRDTKHVCLDFSSLSGQEGQCISRTKTRARQQICTPFFNSENKWNEKKMECGKSEGINNDPEVSRCLNAPTITLDNSCHTQYI